MVCTYCNHKTQVTNSRLQRKSNKIWRRRFCPSCNNTFTTIEQLQDVILINESAPHKQKPIQRFSRDNLFLSIYSSCGHRKHPITDATDLTNTIFDKLMATVRDGTIKKSDLLSITERVLSQFDQTASIYYKAYYEKNLQGLS